ncbi:hypothetical protein CRG98_007540 [Punica granatum]|uniref:Uncharacterized protein n=1 Tax=Punica granatum TaxID=22663 RepID=A0A2I0KUR5_PUNGR|nr:hypothetical protein CRG98_007540 [Punica granatum]
MGTTSLAMISAVKSVLHSFCLESGMKINLEKSKLIFSTNTSINHCQQTCLAFKIQETDNLEKKLAFPIALSPRKEKDFTFVVDKDLRQSIQGLPISLNQDIPDAIIWGLSHDGQLNTKSAYLLHFDHQISPEDSWDWLWKCLTLPCICYFTWLCHKERLPTTSLLAQRGLLIAPHCLRCPSELKTVDHILWSCPTTHSFWQHMQIPPSKLGTLTAPIKDWLSYNIASSQASYLHIPWGVLFTFAIWHLWKNKNSQVFSTKALQSSLVDFTIQATVEYYASQAKPPRKPHLTIQVYWEAPPDGYYKLNFDGCSKGNSGIARARGLIRDSLGRWVRGFYMNLGRTTSPIAELKALRQGLIMVKECGISNLIVDIDAKLILSWVWGNSSNTVLTNLIDDCKGLYRHFDAIIPKHTYREANKCADHLANLRANQPNFLVTFPLSPPSIR